MLERRRIHISIMGSSLTAKVVGGCPQGGVLSPLLWNLVVDRLLTITNDLNFSTFGYTVDIVIIVQGKFPHSQGDHARGPEHGSQMGCKRGSDY
jgi:hypothetical protein